jgi:hypothetical protein
VRYNKLSIFSTNCHGGHQKLYLWCPLLMSIGIKNQFSIIKKLSSLDLSPQGPDPSPPSSICQSSMPPLAAPDLATTYHIQGRKTPPVVAVDARRHLLTFLMQLRSTWNCHCSTSPGVFSRFHIYIFPREEGSLSCLKLIQGVTPTITTRQYRGYVNWG